MLLPELPLKLTFALILFAGAAPAIAQPLACGSEGDAPHQKERDLNVLKNREDAPTPDRIDLISSLSATLAPGPDLHRWNHANGAVFEGVVIKVKPGGYETPNCHATALKDRDTHIEIGLDESAPRNQRVIVEVTPRWRAKMMAQGVNWSTSALRSTLLGRRVRFTGWLLDDFLHANAAENTHPHGLKNWRATIWEIHPVTKIEVLP